MRKSVLVVAVAMLCGHVFAESGIQTDASTNASLKTGEMVVSLSKLTDKPSVIADTSVWRLVSSVTVKKANWEYATGNIGIKGDIGLLRYGGSVRPSKGSVLVEIPSLAAMVKYPDNDIVALHIYDNISATQERNTGPIYHAINKTSISVTCNKDDKEYPIACLGVSNAINDDIPTGNDETGAPRKIGVIELMKIMTSLPDYTLIAFVPKELVPCSLVIETGATKQVYQLAK